MVAMNLKGKCKNVGLFLCFRMIEQRNFKGNSSVSGTRLDELSSAIWTWLGGRNGGHLSGDMVVCAKSCWSLVLFAHTSWDRLCTHLLSVIDHYPQFSTLPDIVQHARWFHRVRWNCIAITYSRQAEYTLLHICFWLRMAIFDLLLTKTSYSSVTYSRGFVDPEDSHWNVVVIMRTSWDIRFGII